MITIELFCDPLNRLRVMSKIVKTLYFNFIKNLWLNRFQRWYHLKAIMVQLITVEQFCDRMNRLRVMTKIVKTYYLNFLKDLCADFDDLGIK